MNGLEKFTRHGRELVRKLGKLGERAVNPSTQGLPEGSARVSRKVVIRQIIMRDCWCAILRYLTAIAWGLFNPVMKSALIAAPVLASYSPTVPLSAFATKRVLPNEAIA
jgi:hypothetical protein